MKKHFKLNTYHFLIQIQKIVNQKVEVEEQLVTPWINEETRKIENPNIRLHNEIIDFYRYIKPKQKDHQERQEAFNRIKKYLETNIENSSLKPFGSFVQEIYLPNADIDCTMIHNGLDSLQLLKKVKKLIKKKSNEFSSITILKNAKVPLIKFVERQSNFQFDICFNENDGIKNAQEFLKALEFYPEMKYLMFVMKVFLSQRRLNQTFLGGIGSFLLFCMILAFLRDLKRNHAQNEKSIEKCNDLSLADYLLRFLNFYGTFSCQNKYIEISNGGAIRKKQNQNDSNFSLISPIDGSDIGNQAFKIKECLFIFKNRYNVLTNTHFQKGESILKYLINPSNHEFKKYLN